jgi:hypothetical protein
LTDDQQSQFKDSLVGVTGKDGDASMFIVGVIDGKDRLATCKESLEKGLPDILDAFKGTQDPAGSQSVTVDGDSATQTAISFGETEMMPASRGAMMCIEHGDKQYGVIFKTPEQTADADFTAVVNSWKWS